MHRRQPREIPALGGLHLLLPFCCTLLIVFTFFFPDRAALNTGAEWLWLWRLQGTASGDSPSIFIVHPEVPNTRPENAEGVAMLRSRSISMRCGAVQFVCELCVMRHQSPCAARRQSLCQCGFQMLSPAERLSPFLASSSTVIVVCLAFTPAYPSTNYI